MKHILTFCILLVALCIASPAQSWPIYNRGTAADSELLDGLDSTAFTLQSSFIAYTSTAGGGGAAYVNLTGGTMTGPLIVLDKITGGVKSTSSGTYSAVFGGYSNIATTTNSFIGGGSKNRITDNQGVIVGGILNQVTNLYGFIGGGFTNLASGNTYPTIVGGKLNTASGDLSTIGGGNANTAGSTYSFVGGGFNNTANGYASTVVGGNDNTSSASYSFVGGGTNNSALGDHSVISGGSYATLSADADRTTVDIFGTSTINVTISDAHLIYGEDGYEKKVGIQTLTPRYELDIVGDIANNGSIIFEGMITVYDNYSVTLGDYTIFANATSTPTTIYLPDATAVDGMHVRLKKKDSTDNHIDVCGVGGQDIDGDSCKVLEAENNAIMVYSDGSNWEVLQATSVAHYGEMHVHGNSTATVIDTQSTPHLMQGLLSEESTAGYTFVSGSIGPIATFADYSTTVAGAVKVTDVEHGLTSGTIISISGTTNNYNEVYEATIIDADNFYIFDGYSGTDTGNWQEGDKLVNNTGKSRKYVIGFHGFGTPETNNDVLSFHVYKDTNMLLNLESKRRFTSQTDVGAISGNGLVTIADGETITFAVTNTSGSGDFTMEHVNIVIQSF